MRFRLPLGRKNRVIIRLCSGSSFPLHPIQEFGVKTEQTISSSLHPCVRVETRTNHETRTNYLERVSDLHGLPLAAAEYRDGDERENGLTDGDRPIHAGRPPVKDA